MQNESLIKEIHKEKSKQSNGGGIIRNHEFCMFDENSLDTTKQLGSVMIQNSLD
jgi:hypothetical protein